MRSTPGINPVGVGVIDVSAGPELRSRDRRVKIEAVVRELAAAARGEVRRRGDEASAARRRRQLRHHRRRVSTDNEERFTYFRVATLDYFKTMGYHAAQRTPLYDAPTRRTRRT